MSRTKREITLALLAAIAATASGCGDASEAAGAKPACRESVAAPAYQQAIRADRPLLRRLTKGLRAPGLSLAVAAGGKIVWSVSCGYADMKPRRKVTADTRFRIGSVSKTLTATALTEYAESGRVDLDAPVDRYVNFPSHGGAITLRRLAGHLAGIRHYESQAEVVNRRHFASVTATLGLFAGDPLVAEPGSRFSYSSYGYDVIGAALEHVAGRDFASLMREAVLGPAHMRETTLATAPRAARTTFYELDDSGGVRVAPPIDLSDRLPAAGFLSTPDDLARFGIALTDGTLVGKATAAMMFRSQRTAAGEETGYGLGFEVHPSPFGLFVGHTGAVDGGTAGLLIHVKTGTVLALTTNLGYATAVSPPPPKRGTPDPPRLLLPFIRPQCVGPRRAHV
jgi:CubicO group peptidase (beta-lactamase class C family)